MESDEEKSDVKKKKTKKRKRSVWIKSWLGRRINLGFYETLMKELRFEEELEYKNSFAWHHMTLMRFWDLFKMI